MELTPLVTTMAIVALAELGDKTQLAAMTLSGRYPAAAVFAGAMLAVALIDGISILAGTALAGLFPFQILRLIAAAIFLAFGLKTLGEKDGERIKFRGSRSALLASFSMVAVMELGDKTQFSVVALAVEYNAPLLIFTGMVLAFALLMGAGVLVGCKLIKLIPKKSLRIFTGAIFLAIGVILLAEALII